jgi:Raf kinase inhibitor-like YbhB/YbcL family protein
MDRMRVWLLLAVALAAVVVACGGDDDDSGASPTPAAGAVVFASDAFSPGGEIPLEFSCDGDNVSPPLSWSGLPEGARSLALTMDDLDAGGYVHWVMYDIPPGTMGLAADVPTDETLADGSTQGVNSRGEIGYAGPCPPDGEHRYRFRLYALDAAVDLEAGATLADVEAAIADHVLALSELVGTFSR